MWNDGFDFLNAWLCAKLLFSPIIYISSLVHHRLQSSQWNSGFCTPSFGHMKLTRIFIHRYHTVAHTIALFSSIESWEAPNEMFKVGKLNCICCTNNCEDQQSRFASNDKVRIKSKRCDCQSDLQDVWCVQGWRGDLWVVGGVGGSSYLPSLPVSCDEPL